jgi:hypothetical protein
MSLHFIGIDPDTDRDHCPTVWSDKERQEFVFQGWKADATLLAECLETGPVLDNEAVAGLPSRMARIIEKAAGAAAQATQLR